MSDITWKSKDLGPVDAYALAVAGGYTGTKAQWIAEIAGASTAASDAEAYAKGTRGGEAVDSDDPAYHNNAEYYNELAQTAKTAAQDAAETASAAYNVNLLAPNFDATAAYPAGQHVIYDGGYYVLPAGHEANVTWANTSKTQRTVGEESSDLKSALFDLNSFDVLRPNATYTNRTSSGVTYTWNADKTECTAVGTASGTSVDNIINSISSLPSGFVPGETYYIKCTTTNKNTYLNVVIYENGATSGGDSRAITSDTVITFPATMTGIVVRIRTNNGSTVNAKISGLLILNAQTNKYLSDAVSSLMGKNLIDVKSSTLSNGTDLNNVYGTNEIWLLSSSYTYSNLPQEVTSSAGYLFVYSPRGVTLQLFYAYTGGMVYKRNKAVGGTWDDWAIAGGGNIINQIFNEYTTENTYNVSPSITADTNNYLESTNDTTDVTASIMAMLNSTGICHLGSGVFWVSGIDMPDDSMLIGCGADTKVYLIGTDSTEGYAIKMGSRCTVKDMSVLGNTLNKTGNSDTYPSNTAFVNRHGIIWQGNYSSGGSSIPRRGIISGCYIANFTGGGITCYDTGLNVISGVNITDCIIWYCYAGIYIPYRSEFNRITATMSTHCHYGVINNGGNNCFANCNFSKNTVGYLIDNSSDQSPNNSHGSVTNCIFDHSDNNNGIGIQLLGVEYGYVFTGCQLFYSKIVADNCKGVSFIGFNCGTGENIEINGGQVILFADCIFRTAPTISITNNTLVKWDNCYTYTGTVVGS